jgi:hypothetical protein
MTLADQLDAAADTLIRALHQLVAIDPVRADQTLDRLAARVASAMRTL